MNSSMTLNMRNLRFFQARCSMNWYARTWLGLWDRRRTGARNIAANGEGRLQLSTSRTGL